MLDVPSLLARVEAFSAKHDISPATVVRKATGNPRLYDRMKGRWATLSEDVDRIQRFLDDAEALRVPHGTDGDSPSENNPAAAE